MKPYRFHRHADADLTAASLHDAAVSTELGQRFYRHVHGLLAEVCAAPLRFRASTLSRSFTGSKEQGFLLTAPTEELSAFVRSQLNTPDFFQAQALFTLKRMTPTGGVAPVSGARTY